MNKFPMTEVGGVQLSRMIAGTNWFLGHSHQTHARAGWIRAIQDRNKIADVLEVFLAEGINVVMGPLDPLLVDALKEIKERSGGPVHYLSTPWFEAKGDQPDFDQAAAAFDGCAAAGATFCWPHTGITDRLYDGLTGHIRHMDRLCKMIRSRGMIPGLSTHLPQVIRSADNTGLDVASYICIYNSAGFLMPMEIDWTQRLIANAKKPVTTIKPMAAGRVMPYVGLPFVWSTLRPIDLVTVGTLTPDEAREVIEISRAALEGRQSTQTLQVTRSKKLVM